MIVSKRKTRSGRETLMSFNGFKESDADGRQKRKSIDATLENPGEGINPETVYLYVGKPFRWWWELVRPVRYKFIIAVVLTTISMSMVTIGATVAGWFVDDVYGKGDTSKILFYCLLLVLVPVIRSILGLVYRFLYEICSQDLLLRLRAGVYRHLQDMDGPFYDKTSVGDLMSRMTGDLDMVRHSTAYVVVACLEQFIIFTVGLLFIFSINWILALTALAFSPFIIFITTRFSKEVRPVWDQVRKQFSFLNAAVQQNISGNRIVKAFVRADYETEKFEKQNDSYRKINLKSVAVWIKYIPALDGLANFLTIPVILVGGILVIKGQMTLGGLVAFNGLLFVISNPMRSVGGLINEVQRFAASAEKIIELLMEKADVSPKENSAKVKENTKKDKAESNTTEDSKTENYNTSSGIGNLTEGLSHTITEGDSESVQSVVFDHVYFQYFANRVRHAKMDSLTGDNSDKEDFDSEYVLKDISFAARKGETIGIIGSTGSGKTTLINLIARFFDATKGHVLVNGKNVKDYSLLDLRRNIGIVMQEVFLFSDTVEGNIAYGNVNAPIEDVYRYAKIAQADQFISKMPEGYDTIIGERGVGLSGGQRQRIALARALCVDPDILILDDTTSAIDMETEFEIQKGLDRIFSDRTVFVVAHRISSVRKADRIIVLDKGMMAETGNHEELIAKKGIYYNVYMTQSGLFDDNCSECEVGA
jgi:ATP-binding cassette subfamily B multidrug efflux pump